MSDNRLACVVFIDLPESPLLRERRDFQTAKSIINFYHNIIGELRNFYRNEIAVRSGEEYLLLFETPTEAAEFALRLQLFQQKNPECPGISMGIHLGEITVSPEKTFSGLTIDLASRLKSLAYPGQILTSRVIFDNIGNKVFKNVKYYPVIWQSHTKYSMKGIEEPIEVFEIGLKGISKFEKPESSEKAVSEFLVNGYGNWKPHVNADIPNRSKWILKKTLGTGGGGESWLAEHSGTGEKRVFKFCFDEKKLLNLKKEVTLFRILRESFNDKKRINKIIDWQFAVYPYYIESEYVEGQNLLEWAQSYGGIHKISQKLWLAIIAKTAEALNGAHSVGVVHKDIKPSNILVRTNSPINGIPEITIIDFGVGHIIDRSLLKNFNLTTGFTDGNDSGWSGTRLYMAPELIEGKTPTVHSDIYALGVILYQIICGDFSRTIASGWERDIQDPLLREDIACCIDRDPKKRFDSASDLYRRLQSLEDRYLAVQQQELIARLQEKEILRSRKNKKRLYLAFVGLSISAITVSGLTYFSYRRALDATQKAALHEQAVSAKNEAERQQHKAEDALLEARRQTQLAILAKQEAQLQFEAAQKEQYFSSINIITELVSKGNLLKAAEIILTGTPEPLRNWEWGFLVDKTYPGSYIINKHTIDDAALDAEFSSDGSKIVTGSKSGTLSIFDGKTFNLLQKKSILNRGAWRTRWSPDNNLIGVAGLNNTAYIVNAKDLSIKFELPGHKDILRGLAFSPDNKLMAVCGADTFITVYDIATGEIVKRWANSSHKAYDIEFSPDGKTLACASLGPTFTLWSTEDFSLVNQWDVETESLISVTFSPDSSHVLLSTNTRSLFLYDTATGELVKSAENLKDYIHDTAFHPTLPFFVTVNNAGECVIRDSKTFDIKASAFTGSPVYHTGFSPDGNILLTAGGSFDRAWNVNSLLNKNILNPTTSESSSLDKAPNLEVNNVMTIPLERNRDWKNYDAFYNESPHALKYIDDGTTFAISSWYHIHSPNGKWRLDIEPKGLTGRVYDKERQKLLPLRILRNICAARFSPDCNYLVVGRNNDINKITVYDTSTWETVPFKNQDPVTSETVYSIAFTSDSQTMGIGTLSGNHYLYDMKSFKEVQKLAAHNRPILTTSFTNSGTRFITGSTDGVLKLFRTSDGEQLTTYTGHLSYVLGASFSPDETRIVSTGHDFTIKLWDVDTGRELLDVVNLKAAGIRFLGAWFTRDGKKIYCADTNGQLRVFSTFPWIKKEQDLIEGDTLEQKIENRSQKAFLSEMD